MTILVKSVREKRLIDEIFQLAKENKPCYYLMKDISKFVEDKYGLDTIITHIYRKLSEQHKFYGKDTTRVSPHQLFHSFDIRSRIFNNDEIKEIVDYVNTKYNATNYYKTTCMAHEVIKDGKSFGMHFHCQYLTKD